MQRAGVGRASVGGSIGVTARCGLARAAADRARPPPARRRLSATQSRPIVAAVRCSAAFSNLSHIERSYAPALLFNINYTCCIRSIYHCLY